MAIVIRIPPLCPGKAFSLLMHGIFSVSAVWQGRDLLAVTKSMPCNAGFDHKRQEGKADTCTQCQGMCFSMPNAHTHHSILRSALFVDAAWHGQRAIRHRGFHDLSQTNQAGLFPDSHYRRSLHTHILPPENGLKLLSRKCCVHSHAKNGTC